MRSASSPADHVVAALVALHLLAVGAGALPSPRGGVDASILESAAARDQVDFVTGAADAIGLQADRERVAGGLWVVGSGLRTVRSFLTAPFAPYYRYAGTTQSWRMFGTVDHAPRRFTVDLDRGRGWETVYALGDPAHAWRADTFGHERVRAVLMDFEGKPRRSYRGFAHRVAGWALADFPDARAVRTRLVQRRTALPDRAPGRPVDCEVLTFTRGGTGADPSGADLRQEGPQ